MAVEVKCHDLNVEDFPTRGGIRQTYNKLVKRGFQVIRFTGSRGTILSPSGQDTGKIGDSVFLRAENPTTRRVVLATWLENTPDKMTLAWARVGTYDQTFYYGYDVVGATELKKWIDQ